ncbi:MAG TPA: metallophosphoesterase [Gaiellaceae bacterium]|nr:metallophosphoesterase [Gaiellaceae bacterium]
MLRGVLILAVVIALPSSGQAGRPASADTVGLLAVGDFGVGGDAQRRLGEGMRLFEQRSGADVLITLGDNDYTADPVAFHANWEETFGWARRRGVNVRGVLGNHDVRLGGGRYEFDELRMPRRYYRFSTPLVDFFLLDSNDVRAAQTTWLRRALARSKTRWRVAVLHHPPFTCGEYRSHAAIVRRWVPLFERYRVRLVLSGHDHNYQRFAPRRGVRYVVHGGGGGRFYALAACPHGYPPRRRARVEQGFLHFVFRPNRIDGWSVTVGGRRTDHFVIAG